MEKQPRYVSELISYADHFVFHIYDTHRKKSLRGIKLRNQDSLHVKYECVEAVVGEIGETYPDVRRRAEERLADLNCAGLWPSELSSGSAAPRIER